MRQKKYQMRSESGKNLKSEAEKVARRRLEQSPLPHNYFSIGHFKGNHPSPTINTLERPEAYQVYNSQKVDPDGLN